MNFALHKLLHYCENQTTAPSDILYQLERETFLKTLAPQMLSGHLQGRLLAFISQLKQPNTILEIGTFTGYAALCLAEGLAEGGQLHTIEANEELEYIIRKYIEKSNLQEQITLHIGNAKDILPTLKTTFDLAFIDAGKKDNEYYFDTIIDKMNPKGFILVDNVLWSGKVVQKTHDNDTRLIHAFNKKIHQDPRVDNLMLPIRDGLMIIQKR